METDRENRLKALSIDDQKREILRECRPFIEATLDQSIRNAYNKIMEFPDGAKVYASIVDDACRAQRAHWINDMFPATFSEEQLRRGIDLFSTRQRQGISLRWFFVFYTNLLRGMIAACLPHYRRKPERLVQVMDALTSVVMFEVEMASSAYMESAHNEASLVINRTADQFEAEVSNVVGQVASSVTQLKSAAETMASIANQTAGEATSAASAAEQTRDNIKTVSTATDELAGSIREISSQVGKSAQIAEDAVQEADRTNVLVQGLADTVGKIGDVVKLINNIASQTNLLALNATIEAARAGDAGKGFAVVAGEVKNLANQTSKATDDISAQIAAVQKATRDAVAAIQGIGTTIIKINEISTTVASAVEEQEAATREIARNVEGAVKGGNQVSATISAVTSLADKTDGTAREVSTSVGSLSSLADRLSNQVTQFLSKVREN